MPRKYVKKSNRLLWSESDMLLAIKKVLEGRMGYLLASRTYNVPKSSLEDRIKKIKGGKSKDEVFRKCSGIAKCVFTNELESMLVEHIKAMESQLIGLTKKDLRRLAYEFAERNSLKHPFNKDIQLAGFDWVNGFLKRHPELLLRSPKPTSDARAIGFNKAVVSSFFKILVSLYAKHGLDSTRIYNMDETGLTSKPQKIETITSHKGKKEALHLATSVICFSAAGHYVPPLLIFPRVQMKGELLNGAPPGTVAACDSSGWMQQHIFTEWMRHFISYVKPSNEQSVLLVLNGHATHSENLEANELARAHGVILLYVPLYCSHRLHPFDVGFMGPLNTFYSQEVQLWQRNHPKRVVTQFQVVSLFGTAYNRTAIMRNARLAFAKTGICPLNPNMFTDIDFALSQTTEK